MRGNCAKNYLVVCLMALFLRANASGDVALLPNAVVDSLSNILDPSGGRGEGDRDIEVDLGGGSVVTVSLGTPAYTVLGWEFSPVKDLEVSALGWVTSLSGISEPHQLGLFDANGNLLVSTLVDTASSADLIAWSGVDVTRLFANERYVIAGTDIPTSFQTSEPPDAGVAVGAFSDYQVSPVVSLIGERRAFNKGDGLNIPLLFPTEQIDADFYGQYLPSESYEFAMGPTFRFSVVPEPPPMGLLMLAGISLLLRATRKKGNRYALWYSESVV